MDEFLSKIFEYSLVAISTYLIFVNKKLSKHDNDIALMQKDIEILREDTQALKCKNYKREV